jgi:hypothetical protein
MKFSWIIGSVMALAASTSAQELAEIRASDAAAKDYFGHSVAISGGTIVVGASQDDDGGSASGSVYVYDGNGATWSEQAKLTASDASGDDFFGSSVAVHGDTLVVGAHGDDLVNGSKYDEGSAYVFVRSGASWSQQAKITASDAAPKDLFGLSAAVDQDTVVIGAPYHDDAGAESGSVYVFVRSGGVWSQQAKLTAIDGAPGDLFGASVSVAGETVVIGSPRDDDGGKNSGSVYVFVRSGSVWSQQAKVTAGDAAPYDSFGRSVSVFGDTAAIGAFQSDAAGVNSGSAYVFTRSGNSWTERAELVGSDTAALDSFGCSLSLDDGRLVVGAFGDNDSGAGSGSAYAFAGSGSSWTQVGKLVPTEAAAADFFGSTIGISGGMAVVGSGWDDDSGLNSGSAHAFWVPPSAVTFCTSKVSSIPGCVPTLSAPAGIASISGGPGSFDLNCGPIPGGKIGIYIYSVNNPNPNPPNTPFGYLCLTDLHRGPAALAGGTNNVCNGNLNWDFGANIPGLIGIGAGDVVSVQSWYRDPPSTPGGANLSNGVSFLLTP